MTQWVKARAAKPDNMSSIPMTDMVEREHQLLHVTSTCIPTPPINKCSKEYFLLKRIGSLIGNIKCGGT